MSSEIRTIVEKALRAPTGDNCQPWKFEWRGDSLVISHDPARAKHRLNVRNIPSLLSFGALLESIAIAASEFGWSAYASLAEAAAFASSTPEIWATIQFAETSSAPDPLLAALPRRTTDRRAFRGGAFDEAFLVQFSPDSERFSNARIHWAHGAFPKSLVRHVERMEALALSDSRVIRDLTRWIRFGRKEVERFRDGMPSSGLGISTPETFALRALRKLPWLQKLFNLFGAVSMHRKATRARLLSSAALFCVTVKSDSPVAVIEAGRLAMRAWLRLTQLGYGVQPLTIPSTFVYAAKSGALENDYSAEWSRLALQGESALQSAFAIPDGETPIWMMRTGISDELPAAQRSPRLEVSTVFATAN